MKEISLLPYPYLFSVFKLHNFAIFHCICSYIETIDGRVLTVTLEGSTGKISSPRTRIKYRANARVDGFDVTSNAKFSFSVDGADVRKLQSKEDFVLDARDGNSFEADSTFILTVSARYHAVQNFIQKIGVYVSLFIKSNQK